jgi:hypothetical protein
VSFSVFGFDYGGMAGASSCQAKQEKYMNKKKLNINLVQQL